MLTGRAHAAEYVSAQVCEYVRFVHGCERLYSRLPLLIINLPSPSTNYLIRNCPCDNMLINSVIGNQVLIL